MKKVVLLGDSIRMGYDKYVKEALADSAQVYYPEENCRFAEYVLRYAHEWKNNGKWGSDIDVVHWNAGLWDCLELFGDEPMTNIGYYEEAIRRIDKRLRMLFPEAKMIFATSTPVQEERMKADFKRHNATIRLYNQVAVYALSGTDTVINDLYAVCEALPEQAHSDAVHYYTDMGTAAIGGKVIAEICNAAGIEASEVKLEDFEPEKYSVGNIGY